MARDIENVNITLPGESDTIELIVDGEPTEVVIALDSWASAVHADDADTVSGHTVARDVLADEYTNAQIDSMVETAGTVKTVNTVQPDQNGNVQISKADIGLGNVDNTSDADKPISTATQAALDLKVDKVDGKGLSTNDYTDADKTKLGDLPTDAEITAALAGKVDKETGKGLSTNDFTDAEKTKLQGIETGAQVNTVTGVKGSAEQTYRTGNIDITKTNIGLGDVDNTADLDKPVSTAMRTALDGKVDKETGKGLSSNDFTTEEKNKLAGIEAGAEVNVQANWNEMDQTADSFIQNKPTIPAKTSDLQNDSGFITGVNWGAIGGTLADQTDLNNELTALVKSVNSETPDANGNVAIKAENIPAQGYGNESTSGNPITITDGTPSTVKNLDVSLEPIQDLHGYDHPWPAGGGKNLLPPLTGGATANGITVDAVDSNGRIRVHGTATANADISLGLTSNVVIPTTAYLHMRNSATAEGTIMVKTDTGLRAPGLSAINRIFDISENSGQTITEMRMSYLAGYSYDVTIQLSLETTSDITDWEPYSNICPISGRTEANVLRTGKNVLKLTVDELKTKNTKSGSSWNGNVYSWQGITYEILVDSAGNVMGVLVNGTSTNNSYLEIPHNMKSGESYIASGCPSGGSNPTFMFYDTYNGMFYDYGNGSSSFMFDGRKCVPSVHIKGGVTVSNLIFKPMIRRASISDATFEPYQGQSVKVQLGQTVYGGTLNVTTGELVVDRGVVVMDGTTNVVSRGNVGSGFIQTEWDSYRSIGKANANFISDRFETTTSTNRNTFSVYPSPTAARMYLAFPATFGNVNACNTWLVDNPVTVVYELATPLTFNLTPAQLALLEGYNILTTDGDTINLRYIGTEASDVQAEIDEFETAIHALSESVAPIETGTAIATHAVGDYIMLNGEFCKVISAIAVGETITIGTNVSRTTIADELKAIIAQLGA